jgi:flagellar biosynthetic protein FliP
MALFSEIFELTRGATVALIMSGDHDTGLMTVNVVPKPKEDHKEAGLSQDLTLVATPEEFDAHFLDAVRGYRAARSGLLLPRLDASIPAEVHSVRVSATNARLAHFLVAAGVVRERDVPRSWHDPLTVCEAALQRWLGRHLGALHCLSPWFLLSQTCGGEPCESGTERKPDGVRIRWGESAVLRWDIGEGLERLERHEPGLGAAILSVIDASAGKLYPLFTPRTALDVASFLYWHGEDDEGMALEEMCDTPEEREAMRAEMVTRAAIGEAFPPWALEPPGLSDAQALLSRMVVSLALFLTLFTMAPVLKDVNANAVEPYLAGKADAERTVKQAIGPLREFMVRQTREQDMALMVDLAKAERPETVEDISLVQLIPAFMLSELRTGFQIGFVIFLPFLLVDLIVSSALMSLGMMMVPPASIALPLKILLFVLMDGWNLVVRALLGTFA